MSIKSQLKRSLHAILLNDHQGSYATRADRRTVLLKTAEELVNLGYKIPTIQQLKPKHINALVNYWQGKNLSNGTLKNRLSSLRHLAAMINKAGIIPSNKQLTIGARNYTATQNRAMVNPNLAAITNPYVRISLELQRVFGLRREESLKIKPHLADQGDKLHLIGTWCKGNRSRDIPIRTAEQRHWLEEAKLFVGRADKSLIPAEKSYIQQRYVYDKQLQQAGIRSHGLRHAYAQQRYKELTGWDAPICGGMKSKNMDHQQRKSDVTARMILTEELGHSRLEITRNYLG